jgi:serine/threonine protein kinase/Flp pilus assembly protein TadD
MPLGDFRILREIGRGGMGVVYEAEQLSLGRRVALKVLPFAATLDPKQMQRFKNEAQAAAGLHHTNIVPVYFVGCERGVHFYAMQFIEGQTLAALIRQLREEAGLQGREDWVRENGLEPQRFDPTPTGPYSPDGAASPEIHTPEAVTRNQGDSGTVSFALSPRPRFADSRFFRTVANLGIQAAEALEHAHQLGVIHRDIKPANLMVDARGNLWITDFGLAHCQSQAGLTMSGDLVGTLRYMSPEQALAKRVLVDQRTDIYSLGATLYELLTLEAAFAGKDRQELLRQIAFEEPKAPKRLNKAIPAELETIVLKAIEKNPEERYATAQELADDLERFLRDEPIHAKRPGHVQRGRKWARRHQAQIRVAAAVAIVGLLAGTVLLWREKDNTSEAYKAEASQRQRADDNLRLAMKTLDEIHVDLAQFELPRDAAHQDRYRRLLQKVIAFYKQFIENNPTNPQGPFELGRAYGQVAEVHRWLGQVDQAEGAYKEAISVLEQVSADFPAEPSYRHELAVVYNNWGILLFQNGRSGEAEKAWQKTLSLREKLMSESPDEPSYQSTLGGTLHNLGNVRYHAGQVPEAIRLYEEAIRHQRAALKSQPEKAEYRVFLGNHYGNLADCLKELGKRTEAEDSYREALTIRRKLVDDFPNADPANRWNLAGSYSHLGILLRDTGRRREAEQNFQQALAILQKLADDIPNVPVYKHDLGGVLNNLAIELSARGETKEGRQLLEKAIFYQQAALKILPRNPQYRQYLHNHYHLLLQTLLRLGEHAAVAKEVDEFLRNFPESSDDYVLALSFLAGCMPLAESDTKLSQVERQAQTKVYSDRVKELVSAAEEKNKNQNANVCNNLAWRLATWSSPQLRDPARAVELAKKAVEKGHKIGTYWNTLGVAYYRLGDWKGSISALEKSMELRKGGDCFDWFFLAMAHWQLGDKEQARKWYDQAVKWMEKNKTQDEELSRFRAEAAKLMGLPDPKTKGVALETVQKKAKPWQTTGVI